MNHAADAACPGAALAATLERLAPTWSITATIDPAGPGWLPYPDRVGETAVARMLAEIAAHQQSDLPVAAQSLVSRLAGPAAMLAAAAVFTDRRLPAPGPAELAIRWLVDGESAPRADGVAFGATRLLVLPGDPVVGAPGVETVADLAELQDALTGWVYDTFAPLVDEVSRQSRRGRRALWQGVADRIGGGFLQPGKAVGAADRARAEATATLGRAPKPLRIVPDWLQIEHEGVAHLFKRKSVCCLYYKVPANRDEYCNTCPLIERDETVRRLREHLAAG